MLRQYEEFPNHLCMVGFGYITERQCLVKQKYQRYLDLYHSKMNYTDT